MTIAIVVVGYNRPKALEDLLKSLSKIVTEREVPLVISIDNKGTEAVNRLAEQYEWAHGPKEVLIHQQKKGLVKHFIWTGDQTDKYDVVIFLEDDLLVSPQIINYVEQVASFYEKDERIAGASLYNPFINEITGARFYQLQDGYDNYFLQQPYWGHVWFKKPWKEFQEFLKDYKPNKDILPKGIRDWEGSFKKIFIQFLVEKGKYIVTPRVSLLTNNGVPGIHSGDRESFFQCPVCMEAKEYHFSRLEESLSIYDSSLEIEPKILKHYCSELADYDFEVDVNGTKTPYKSQYVLTTKPVRKSVMTFSSLMKPVEQAVVTRQVGNQGLHFCLKEDVIEEKSYYRKFRYNDIHKNYPVSVLVGLYMIPFTIKRFTLVIKGKILK